MAYDEKLAARAREVLDSRDDVIEKKMFGGLAFMVAGTMACGVVGDDLMARVGAEHYDAALERPHTRPMNFTGKPLRGLVYVGPAGIRTAAMLKKWIDEVVAVALATPAKKKKAKKTLAGRKKKTTRR